MYDIFYVITTRARGKNMMQLELIWITVDVSYRDRINLTK